MIVEESHLKYLIGIILTKYSNQEVSWLKAREELYNLINRSQRVGFSGMDGQIIEEEGE